MATRAELEAIIKLKEEISGKVAVVDKKLSQLDRSLSKVKANTGDLTGSFRKGALQAAGLASAVGLAAIGVSALARTLVDSVRVSAQFESSMVRIETLVGISRGEVQGMEADVKRLAGETARSPIELSEALFQITSAGLRGKEALDVLEASAKASAIGLGEISTIADAATSVMNAYGAENVSAEKAVGLLLQTVREGKLEPAELASSIGKVIPIASSMGVAIEEVSASVASLTRVGSSASEAVNQVRAILTSILNPSAQAAEVLGDVGLSMDAVRASLQEDGLIATLGLLRERLDDSQLAKFAGRVEATAGIMALAGDRLQETTHILGEMDKALQVVDEGFARVGETAEFRAAKVSAAWEAAKISVGSFVTDIAFELVEHRDEIERFFSRSVELGGGGPLGAAIDSLRGKLDGLGESALASSAEFLGDSLRIGGPIRASIEGIIATFDDLDVSSESFGQSLAATGAAALEAGADFGQLRSSAEETAAAIVGGFLETGKIVPPTLEKVAAAAGLTKEELEALEKAEKAAAKAAEDHRKAVANLAGELSGSKLAGEMHLLSEALVSLDESGSDLTEKGFQQVLDTIKELKEAGVELDPILAQIDQRMRLMLENLRAAAPELAVGFELTEDALLGVDEAAEALAKDTERLTTIAGDTRTLLKATFEETKPHIIDIDDLTKGWADTLSETRGLMNLLGVQSDSALGRIVDGFSRVFDTANAVLGLISRIGGAIGSLSGAGSTIGKIAGVFGGGGGGGTIGNVRTIASAAGTVFGGGAVAGIGGAATAGAASGAVTGAGLGAVGAGVGAGGAVAGAAGGAAGGAGLSALAATGYGAIAVAAIVAIRAALKKASAETTAEFLGIDFGALSDNLQDALQDMGKQAGDFATGIQLGMGDIFREQIASGTADFDVLAGQAADTFSFLERGQITTTEAQAILNDTVGQLLPHLQELGPEGQAQIERLTHAAQMMGVEFEGLDELMAFRITDQTLVEMGLVGEKSLDRIREAAAELGVDFEILFEKIQGTFAPATLEEMAKQFGLTNDEVRALSEELGLNIQTDLERMAATIGLSADEFQRLGAALEDQVGVPAEDLLAFLEASGISAEDLADKLGVEVAGGAEDLNDETEKSADHIESAAAAAGRLADELGRAAGNAGGIRVPGLGGDIPGFAHGGFVPASPPFGRVVRVAEEEGEFIVPESQRGAMGGGSIVIAPTVNISGLFTGSVEDAARLMGPILVRTIRDDLNVQRELGRVT